MHALILVTYRFTDEQVLSPEFKNELLRVVKIVQPLVYWYVALGLSIQYQDSWDSWLLA